MAASPPIKVFNPAGVYIASCKHFEDAAALVSLNGNGSQVKWHHSGWVLWTEGAEDIPAGESYDRAGLLMAERLAEKQRAAYAKVHGH